MESDPIAPQWSLTPLPLPPLPHCRVDPRYRHAGGSAPGGNVSAIRIGSPSPNCSGWECLRVFRTRDGSGPYASGINTPGLLFLFERQVGLRRPCMAAMEWRVGDRPPPALFVHRASVCIHSRQRERGNIRSDNALAEVKKGDVKLTIRDCQHYRCEKP